MSTYVIGDIQGCYRELRKLLDLIKFDPTEDYLWLAGDLVNRGPDSLAVLRYVRSLGDRAVAVLGNHDLHLLAAANGGRVHGQDTLTPILTAPDRDQLLDWLRHCPLLHENAEHRVAMIHAGLPPQWNLGTARSCAREIESALQSDEWPDLLNRMYGDQPNLWDEALTGIERLRFAINCFTRLRYCDAEGRLQLREKGRPGEPNGQILPWFAAPGAAWRGTELIFGHWSTLGQVYWPQYRVYGLDTGCLWGGHLTALRLEDRQIVSIPCPGYQAPGQD